MKSMSVRASERRSVRASERRSVWKRRGQRTVERTLHAPTLPRSHAPTLPRSHAPTLPRSHAPTLFEDVSHLLQHTHHDEPFDDFARQPLLPKRLSTLGPGVAWHDVDGDGWDDLIIGAGRGGQLAVFRNDGRGGLAAPSDAPSNRPVTRDQTTILGLEAN